MDHLYLFAWPHAFVYAFLMCLHFLFICLHVFVLHCHNVEHVSPDFSSTTTMAAKESGFDLMNPPESSHPPPLKISPAVQQKCEACLIKES